MNPDDTEEKDNTQQSAVDLVREKIDSLYQEEPDVRTEEKEVMATKDLSKHQKFMQSLMKSGKTTEEIQNLWHQYYLGLNEAEKKEVWDEFYSSNKTLPLSERVKEPTKRMASVKKEVVSTRSRKPRVPARSPAKRVEKALKKDSIRAVLKPKHYLQSVLFGLSMGFLVLFIFLFSFFNEVIIAPLIQPSRSAQATPVIIGQGDLTATNVDQVIIPKINVEIPVDYDVNTTNESVIENDLEAGVIHYPDTPVPGQIGNAAFFGHSSNNIFNPGKYKFAFVLLHTLVKGDTFYLTYNHTIYIYKVIYTTIVNPSATYVLASIPGQTATASLITCDPPGTSINRLVVVGQQISPNVSTDTVPAITINASKETKSLPSDGPSLWSRFVNSGEGKTTIVIVGIVLVAVIFRLTNKRTAH